MPDLNSVFVPHLGREFKFHDRSRMRPPFVGRSFRLPRKTGWQPPETPTPVDSTGDGKVDCPILGNDTYGDCGAAMVAHRKQIIEFRQGKGKQYPIDTATLVRQYLRVAGGDNGLEEPQVIQILKTGIAGINDDLYVDALDIDLNDPAMVRFCIDQFATVQMGWSVPNAFINGFATGSVWSGPGRPNPRHGHYTPLADVAGKDTPIPDVGPTGGGRTPRMMHEAMKEADCHPDSFSASGQNLDGFYRLYTWGGWAWVSQAFVSSVNPDGFVVFTLGMFDKSTGLDSKGRHITSQAKLWQLCGGNPIPDSIVGSFPAVSLPTDPWASWE